MSLVCRGDTMNTNEILLLNRNEIYRHTINAINDVLNENIYAEEQIAYIQELVNNCRKATEDEPSVQKGR